MSKQSQQESAHFSQPDSRVVKADSAAIDKVDLSQLKKHKRLASKQELTEVFHDTCLLHICCNIAMVLLLAVTRLGMHKSVLYQPYGRLFCYDCTTDRRCMLV
jgi:hypothetical protein